MEATNNKEADHTEQPNEFSLEFHLGKKTEHLHQLQSNVNNPSAQSPVNYPMYLVLGVFAIISGKKKFDIDSANEYYIIPNNMPFTRMSGAS